MNYFQQPPVHCCCPAALAGSSDSGEGDAETLPRERSSSLTPILTAGRRGKYARNKSGATGVLRRDNYFGLMAPAATDSVTAS